MRLLLLSFGFLLLEGFARFHPLDDSLAARQRALRYKQQNLVGCGTSLAAFDPAANPIPLLSGWGNYRMPVTGKNDSALIYFQQGINLYYGFHIIEALASFDKSTRLDSGFAMGYWGKALAYGPNINDYGYAASPAAPEAADRARSLSAGLSPENRALIDAMGSRYSTDTSLSREVLNQRYVDAMRNAYRRFPQSPDIAVLYADALMQQHPWDLYDLRGKPKPWTPPLVAVLEGVLRTTPAHPGAAHYYIHSVEASDHPGRALAATDALPGLMPGVSHVVHMPAHIYIRTGRYAKGWDVNIRAVSGYYDYLGKFPSVADNSPLYLGHNLHFQAACASMDGRYADALRASWDTRHSFDSSWMSQPAFMGIFMQYVYMTPMLTQVRFGKWDSVLSADRPAAAYVYADVLAHYSRGVAFARKGLLDSAAVELDALWRDTANQQLFAPAPSYSNPGINGTRVAGKILAGVLAESRGQYATAVALLQEAAAFEDAMIYDEPKDWQQPARQFLGSVLIKADRFAEAEAAFRQDLAIHPGNGWSYWGLAAALTRQGKKREAAVAADAARTAFARSDMKITAAVLP